MAALTKGKMLQHIRWAFPNRKEYLMLIIDSGDCYILDALSEEPVEAWTDLEKKNESDDEDVLGAESESEALGEDEKQVRKYRQAKVAHNSLIDLKGGYLLTVDSRSGCGTVHHCWAETISKGQSFKGGAARLSAKNVLVEGLPA
jgi:hypothetical protein